MSMTTIRRLIYKDVLRSIAFVALGFLCLFFFFDFVDELDAVGKGLTDAYRLPQALIYVLLQVPSHLYELLPIAVLIGTIFVLSNLARSSEFTILRTSGLGPWRALRMLLVLGSAFVVLTVAVGDYVAPWASRTAQLLKSQHQGYLLSAGLTGGWLRETRDDHTFAVNVLSIEPDGSVKQPRIFEFDPRGFLVSKTNAASAGIGREGWLLKDVHRQEFQTQNPDGSARVAITAQPYYAWPSTITADMVSVALLRPERMKTLDLFDYIRHLEANGQDAQRYEIEFWRKVFYPLSCLVMVVLALPFAYLHFRQSGIAGDVFGGVMIGISFFLLNNVFGYIGNLRNWLPWITAAAPGIIYSMLSLGAFGWLVLRR